jgi:acetylornithine/succinyldiaminopimelate/putrescine aminotransferase
LVFLAELIDRDLMTHVAATGLHLEGRLREIASRHAIVRDVRGAGLIWGIDLDRPALPVVEAALELGLLVNRTSDTVVRLLPPFVITEGEVDEACALLDRAIGKVAEAKAS